MNVILYCLTKLKTEYLARLPVILKSLMDVCLEKLEPTIMLFMRNIFLSETGKDGYDFALKFMKTMSKKLKMLLAKSKGILPFLVFKCIRLISICQLHKDCKDLQAECENIITFVFEHHKHCKP